MRYLLFWHTREAELQERTPEWHEEAGAFLARYEDELNSKSELDWVEVLAPESQAAVVGPGGELHPGNYNAEAKPAVRVWSLRVDSKDRAEEIAAQFAGELDTWIEVREIFEGAHRP